MPDTPDLPGLAARIRELDAKATAGEWTVRVPDEAIDPWVWIASTAERPWQPHSGAQFIAHRAFHGKPRSAAIADANLTAFLRNHALTIADALERCGKMEKALEDLIETSGFKETHFGDWRASILRAYAALTKDAQP